MNPGREAGKLKNLANATNSFPLASKADEIVTKNPASVNVKK